MIGDIKIQYVHFYPDDDQEIINQIADTIHQSILLEYRMMEIINSEEEEWD